MHDLIAKLTTMLSLTPEQQFRVSAMIKREIHDEKASVYGRLAMYAKDAGAPARFVELTEIKAEGHEAMSKLPDEEVITWSIGTHKYVQKVEPCSVCKVELTGKPYSRVVDKTGNFTFCPEHAPKD